MGLVSSLRSWHCPAVSSSSRPGGRLTLETGVCKPYLVLSPCAKEQGETPGGV